MSSQSLEPPTAEDHEATRKKYVTLSWDLWLRQYEVGFYVWHPIPERHLEIELALFWRGEIAHIHGWSDIVGQITKPILDGIKGLLSWLWKTLIRPGVQVLLNVLRGVMDAAFQAVRWILNGITSVVQGIQAGVAGLGTAISSGLGWLAGELTKATSWIWDQMSGLFSAIGEVLKNIGMWIVTAIKTHVVDPLIGLLKPVFDTLKNLIMGIWTFITGGAIKGSPIEWRGSYTRWIGIISGVGVMAVSGLIGAKLIDVIHPMKDTNVSDVAKFAMQFSGFAFLMSAFYGTYFDIACAKPVRQELNAIFTPEIPGEGELMTMLYREVIPREEFNVAMSMHGKSGYWTDKLVKVAEGIPGPGDLTTFMVREVITPDIYTHNMALQRFSKYWADAYWEAHWMLPPTERTRTAFLRKDIPEAEYRKFLIWYDFKPDPRPGISLSDVDIMLKTQYDWPGRIDTRWLIEWGIIDEAAGLELIKAGGMDPAWAPKCLEAYMLNQLREELGKVRGVYERRLREGFMSKEGFARALHGIHFATHVINALIRWADEALDLDEKIELAKEYEALAKAGAITVDGYAEKLRKLGMVEERITRKQRHIKTLLEIAAAKEAAKAAAKGAD